ncbi:MAG: ABC transporter permease [Thermoanaerobacterales bacterium]|nr:ABC transporter permease [Thermoanaerobacterales bacterium]
MNLRRTLRSIIGIAYVESLQLLRNRTQAVIFLLVPLLMHLFLAGVYGDQVLVRIPTAVLDMSRGPLSREVVHHVAADEDLRITAYARDYEEISRWLKAEKVRVAVVIPEDFDRAVARGEPTRILTVIDGSNMIFCNVAGGAVGDVVQDLSARLRAEMMLSGGLLTDRVERILKAVQFPITARYNPTYNYAYFLLLGLSLYILQQTYLLGIVTVVSREKEQGTWPQWRALPVAMWQVYAGKVLPYLAVGIVQAGMICLMGAGLFGMPMHGNLWLLLLLTFVFLVSVSCLAVLISSFTDRIDSIRFAMVMAMPSFILSGFTWPLQAMHPIVRGVAECFPLTWYLSAFQSVTMKGAGWEAAGPCILYMGLLGAVCLVPVLLAVRERERPLNALLYRIRLRIGG